MWKPLLAGLLIIAGSATAQGGSQQVLLIAAGHSGRTELCQYVPDDQTLGAPVPMLVAMHPTSGDGPGAIRAWPRVAFAIRALPK